MAASTSSAETVTVSLTLLPSRRSTEVVSTVDSFRVVCRSVPADRRIACGAGERTRTSTSFPTGT